MKTTGGRSSLGRWSPWPGTYAVMWRLGVVGWLLGLPFGIQGRQAAFWWLEGVGTALAVGAVLYHQRWQRLQKELFRRTER